MTNSQNLFELLDEDTLLTVSELARACAVEAEWVELLTDYGIITPAGESSATYSAVCISRLRKARRLERDFDLNPPALALVLDLLDEIERLRRV
jgi:chaperone modulatory protein CbpM